MRKNLLIVFLSALLCMIPNGMMTACADSSSHTDQMKTVDVLAYFDGTPLHVYEINGETVILLEDLSDYGFSIGYDDSIRTLFVTKTHQKADDFQPVYEREQAGKICGSVVETDIRTFVNGVEIKSCAVNGKMAVAVEDVCAVYGEGETATSIYRMASTFDNTEKKIHLSTQNYPIYGELKGYAYWESEYSRNGQGDNFLLTDDYVIHYWGIHPPHVYEGQKPYVSFYSSISYKNGESEIGIPTIKLYGINTEYMEFQYDGDQLVFPSFKYDSSTGKVLFVTSDKTWELDPYTMLMKEKSATQPDEPDQPGTHENCPSAPFKDVDTSLWYHEGIDYAIEKGMMNGVSDNAFAPDTTTTRAMIVTILYRLEGEPAADAASFKDVESGSWYEAAVNWASANDIVNGCSEEAFDPTDAITREQLAAILYRYAAYKGTDVSGRTELSQFTDAGSVSDWAQEAMAWAVNAELINGMTETTLVPQGSATRAQAATLMMRLCENVLK